MRFGKCNIELEREWFITIKPPFPMEDSNRLWWNWYFYTLASDNNRNVEEIFRVIIWEYPDDFENKHIVLEDIENAFETVSILLKVYEKTGYKAEDFNDLFWNRNINDKQYSQQEFDNLLYDL